MCKTCFDNNPELKKARGVAHDEPAGVLVDWILVMADVKVDDDGSDLTGLGMECNKEASVYRQMGLADYAYTVTKARIFDH